MHAAILHLTPILGAEKSKVPFYIAGGVTVVWALVLSLGIGLRNPSFPTSLGGQRTVMGISALLVLITVSMAVATSGGSKSKVVLTPVTQTGREAASGSGTSSLKDEADPTGQLAYTTKSLSAKAGTVTIAFTNASPLEHNLTIAQGSRVIGATPTFSGGSKTLTLKLKPGIYTFYCTVPGHRAAGMEGKLEVR